jgi:hypothetical protein
LEICFPKETKTFDQSEKENGKFVKNTSHLFYRVNEKKKREPEKARKVKKMNLNLKNQKNLKRKKKEKRNIS